MARHSHAEKNAPFTTLQQKGTTAKHVFPCCMGGGKGLRRQEGWAFEG